MGKTYCCILNCTNYFGKIGKFEKSVTLHQFPNKGKLRSKWISAVLSSGSHLRRRGPESYTCVCSDHFTDGVGPGFPDKKGMFPTENLHLPKNKVGRPRSRKGRALSGNSETSVSEYICEKCGKLFKLESALQGHQGHCSRQLSEEKIPDLNAEELTVFPDVLIDDQHYNHGEQGDPEETCPVPFPTGLFTKVQHNPKSKEDKLEKCLICGKIFKNKKCLMRHFVKRNHGMKKRPNETFFEAINLQAMETESRSMLAETIKTYSRRRQYERLNIQRARLKRLEKLVLRQHKVISKRWKKGNGEELSEKPIKTGTKNLTVKKTKKDAALNPSTKKYICEETQRQPCTTKKKSRRRKLRRNGSYMYLVNPGKAESETPNQAEQVVESSDLFECPICNKIFLSQLYLLKHTSVKHPEEIQLQSGQIPDSPSTQTSPDLSTDHKSQSENCGNDPDKADESDNMMSFMSSISFFENTDVVFECTHCEQTFSNAVSLKEHLYQDHNSI